MIKQSEMKNNYGCYVKTDETGREIVAHGTPLFPARVYLTDLNYEMIPWHWHREMEIIYVDVGVANVLLSGENLCLKAGQGAVINGGVLHSIINGREGESCFRSVVFDPAITGGAETIFRQKYIMPVLAGNFEGVFLTGKEDAELCKNIDNCCNALLDRYEGYEFDFREQASKLILGLRKYIKLKEKADRIKNPRNEERVKKMLSYISENYSDDITLKTIAQTVSISESECLRCFRQVLGISPMKYLKEYRLQKAADMMIVSDEKIKIIALNCGFNDVSYFTKSFKEFKGMLPREYRKNRV